MRVKIQHSVETTEVEDTVYNLILKCIEDMHDRVEELEGLKTLLKVPSSHLKYKVSNEVIENCRGGLALIDSVLSDSYSILGGLYNYHNDSDVKPSTPAPTPSVEVTPETASAIDDFREKFASMAKEIKDANEG